MAADLHVPADRALAARASSTVAEPWTRRRLEWLSRDRRGARDPRRARSARSSWSRPAWRASAPTEPEVQAWQYLDRAACARPGARARPRPHARGAPIGPLHGVPVGIKDIIDTADMPTEDGTVLHAGRTPDRDATVVAMLRAAGAVILGKTVTTELRAPTRPARRAIRTTRAHARAARRRARRRRSPRAWCRSPLGSQTNGSVIRPAAFCGVYGFKPTHGLIPRHGILKLSRTLDHVGRVRAHARGHRAARRAAGRATTSAIPTRGRARASRSSRTAAEEPPLPPRLAFVKTPVWDRADAETREAFAELVEALGDAVRGVRAARIVARGLGLASHHHGSGDGGQPRSRVGQGARPAVGVAARRSSRAGARCSALDYQKALARHAGPQRGLRRAVRALRRDTDAGRARDGARRAAGDRRPGVLHALDAVRHAGAEPAADDAARTACRSACNWSAGAA